MMQKRPFFSHHTLGFKRNPFGALPQDDWTAVALLPPALTTILDLSTAHVQLLGAMGSGKTTTMLKIAGRLSAAEGQLVYEYLAEGERQYKTDTAVLTTFLLDETQRLTRRERKRLLAATRTGLRLILSSHEDLTPLFRRWQRSLSGQRPLSTQRPLLSINLEETLTPDFYGQTLARRLEHFALPGRPHTMFGMDAVQWLYDTFYPNMRDAEYFLYEVWQRETAVREITAVHLQNLWAELR